MHKVKIDVDADIRKAQEELDQLANRFDEVQDKINKTYQKGINNNNTISQKDQTNVNNAVGDYNHLLEELQAFQQKYQNNIPSKDDVGLDTYLKLKENLDEITYNLNNSHLNQRNYQAINNFRTTNSTAFNTFSDPKEQQFYDSQLANFKSIYQEYNKQVQSVARQANNVNKHIDNAINAGVIKDTKLADYDNTNHAILNGGTTLANHVASNRENIIGAKNKIDKEIGRIKGNIAKGNPATTASGDNARLHALEKQSNNLDKLVHSMDKLTEQLDNITQNAQSNSNALHDAIDGGTVDVTQTPPPNSRDNNYWARRRRGRTIAYGVVSMLGTIDEGSDRRTAIYDNISGIMNNEYQNGNHIRKIDNQITDTLLNVANINGTHYTGQQMSELVGAYARSTGKTDNYSIVANDYSRFARYTGVGVNDTAQLETALGNSGITDPNIASVIQGSFVNSHMMGRATDQVNALTAIYQNASQYGLSNTGADAIAVLQQSASQYGSTMQGQNFANAYTSLTNGMTDFNNNVARLAFGGGNAEYSGRDGQAKLLRDMQRAKNGDPAMLNKAIGNVLKSSGGDTLLASATISQMTGVTVDQASHFIDMYKHNKLSDSYLKKQFSKDKHSADTDNDAYNKSGQRTIDNIHQQGDRGKIHLSESNDGVRGIFGNVLGGLNGNVVGLLGGLSLGTLLEGMFSGGGILGKIGNLGRTGAVASFAEKAGTAGKFGSLSKLFTSPISLAFGGYSILRSTGVYDHILDTDYKDNKIHKGDNFLTRWGKNETNWGNKWGFLGMPTTIIGRLTKGAGSLLDDITKPTHVHASTTKRGRVKDDPDTIKAYSLMLTKAQQTIADGHQITIKVTSDNDSENSSSDNSGSSDSSNGTMSKDEFTKVAKEAGKNMGVSLSSHDIDLLYHQAMIESNANPAVGGGIDDHDGTGKPVGLFQYKQATWEHYAVSGHKNIHSALDQVMAVLNDTNWRTDLSPLNEKRGWSPSGALAKHANGGLMTGSYIAIPLNPTHIDAGKQNINRLLNTLGMTTTTQIKARPHYQVNITVDNNANQDEIINAVKQALSSHDTDIYNHLHY